MALLPIRTLSTSAPTFSERCWVNINWPQQSVRVNLGKAFGDWRLVAISTGPLCGWMALFGSHPTIVIGILILKGILRILLDGLVMPDWLHVYNIQLTFLVVNTHFNLTCTKDFTIFILTVLKLGEHVCSNGVCHVHSTLSRLKCNLFMGVPEVLKS